MIIIEAKEKRFFCSIGWKFSKIFYSAFLISKKTNKIKGKVIRIKDHDHK